MDTAADAKVHTSAGWLTAAAAHVTNAYEWSCYVQCTRRYNTQPKTRCEQKRKTKYRDCPLVRIWEMSFIHVCASRETVFNYFGWTFIVWICPFHTFDLRCATASIDVKPIRITNSQRNLNFSIFVSMPAMYGGMNDICTVNFNYNWTVVQFNPVVSCLSSVYCLTNDGNK